jgi:hypothetical protein
LLSRSSSANKSRQKTRRRVVGARGSARRPPINHDRWLSGTTWHRAEIARQQRARRPEVADMLHAAARTENCLRSPAQPNPPELLRRCLAGWTPRARHMTRFRASWITGYRDRQRSQVLLSRNLQGEERASKRGRSR